jgi:hypothetical protein
MSRVKFEMDEKSAVAVKKALEGLATKVRNKAVRLAFREWSKEVIQSMKANVTWNAPKFRRAIAAKIKSFNRGKKMWMGVGVRKDGGKPGWQSNFYEGGWRPWVKGTPSGKTGKGWRAGLAKRNLSTQIYDTHFISRAYRQHMGSFSRILTNRVKEVLGTSKQGN